MSHPNSSPLAADIDRVSPTRVPHRRSAGRQNWRNLLFVHWRLPASLVEPLLPPELTLDTWEGDAWIGVVPFTMTGVRPWWSPPVPGISSFHETNVRTYVHFRGQQPGVWFFSLDAANHLACRLARWGWHLPYHWAQMDLQLQGNVIRYRSQRLEPQSPPATLELTASIGKPIPSHHALPGTLEHFLAERYLLYAKGPTGTLYRGQVSHTPYPLQEAKLEALDESLLAANQITPDCPPCHVLFSKGVQVKVFSLLPLLTN